MIFHYLADFWAICVRFGNERFQKNLDKTCITNLSIALNLFELLDLVLKLVFRVFGLLHLIVLYFFYNL